jgi:hypothetical protein
MTAIIALADDATPPIADLPAGDQLLMQVISQLERRDSVVAQLRHQVSLDGRRLSGVGGYWQQGAGEELQMRLELRVADPQETSLLQVSNGRFLWSDKKLPTGRSITRLDLRPLRTELLQSATELAGIQAGQATWSPVRPEMAAFAGGLPKLLAALSESFTFLPPQAMRLKLEPPLVKESVSLPVFAVVGHWRAERLAALMTKPSGNKKGATDGARQIAKMPARLPQEVLLVVGQADLFPYRIEYRQTASAATAADGSPAPFQLSAQPMVQLEFSDVTFNVPIPASQFDYSPGDMPSDDRTEYELQKLRKERKAHIAAGNTAGAALPATQKR